MTPSQLERPHSWMRTGSWRTDKETCNKNKMTLLIFMTSNMKFLLFFLKTRFPPSPQVLWRDLCLMTAPLLPPPLRCPHPPEFHHWRSEWSSSVLAGQHLQTRFPGCLLPERLDRFQLKFWSSFSFICYFTGCLYVTPACCQVILTESFSSHIHLLKIN